MAPFIVGFPPSDSQQHFGGTLLRRAGLNTGNLLFTHALARVLDHPQLAYGTTFDPAEVAERHDRIVVPAANWLQPRHDFGTLADRIQATGLPCVIVGIGTQIPLGARIPPLQDGLLKLLRVASPPISVRGERSAEVLAHHGIEDVALTGCPSLLWHVNGPRRVEKPERRVERVVLNSSRGAPSEAILTSRQATHRLSLLMSRMAFERRLDFVAQAELPDILYARGEPDDGTYTKRIPDYLERVYGIDDRPALEHYIARHMRTFFSVEPWLDYLRQQDLVFGTRLHGVIAALLAGTPAVLVAHDSRTAEMADLARIPSVPADAVDSSIDFQAIYDAADVEAFNRRAPGYYARFAAFFDAHGLGHQLAAPRNARATLS